MLIPKPPHLVERVAERLLRSGALDESAAQLLRPTGDEVEADAADFGAAAEEATPGAAQPAAAPRPYAAPESSQVAPVPPRRSMLFAPPPAWAKPGAAPAEAFAGGSVASPSVPDTATGGEQSLPDDADPGAGGDPLSGAAPSTDGQTARRASPPGRSSVFDPHADLPSLPPLGRRPAPGDPAAGMLQGAASIDAVSLERAGMVDWSRTRTRISEEFRLVQRQIIRSAFGPGAEPGFSNLLLVTSARPGEGKSFMATNLSGSIARQGDHHVLLVDADSKRDSICYSLGLAQSRGLLDLAANPKLDPAPLIVKTPIERLSILPVGRERERSAELFSTKEMTRLIQSLGRRYADRLLILDAPPCLSTSDPAVLAQVVGQILFVVEADRTQRDEIEASLDLIQACPTITMVLNKQQISSRYTFGAYSSYYSS
ncbi:MAG TPA: hypothetical protein VGC09_13055 [Rhodopila sp.]